MGSADFSRQALLPGGECSIVIAESARSPRVLTRSFPLIPAPSTADVPCSYWTLACLAALSTLRSLSGQLLQASVLPRASFRLTPHGGALASGCILPTAGWIRDFHPLERAPAGRTNKQRRPFTSGLRCFSVVCSTVRCDRTARKVRWPRTSRWAMRTRFRLLQDWYGQRRSPTPPARSGP